MEENEHVQNIRDISNLNIIKQELDHTKKETSQKKDFSFEELFERYRKNNLEHIHNIEQVDPFEHGVDISFVEAESFCELNDININSVKTEDELKLELDEGEQNVKNIFDAQGNNYTFDKPNGVKLKDLVSKEFIPSLNSDTILSKKNSENFINTIVLEKNKIEKLMPEHFSEEFLENKNIDEDIEFFIDCIHEDKEKSHKIKLRHGIHHPKLAEYFESEVRKMSKLFCTQQDPKK